MEFIQHTEVFVHTDGSDLDDLERKLSVFSVLSVRTLVPFKIQNDIIHEIPLS